MSRSACEGKAVAEAENDHNGLIKIKDPNVDAMHSVMCASGSFGRDHHLYSSGERFSTSDLIDYLIDHFPTSSSIHIMLIAHKIPSCR
jgi:hypothetical protein